MKREIDQNTVEMIGLGESVEMTIALTAKVFYTFISGLYTRKTESMVREYISNARDGHAKQGNVERPFFVHGPTRWEPWFSVRDYGCSIDHETLEKRCSVLGWSSKETSDIEIGTWGYGMKSAFAKVKQFTITCWLAGEERVYSYYIAEDGKPRIVLRSCQPSEEEQGVEVRIDIKQDDIDACCEAIRWAALPYNPCFESNLSNVRSAQVYDDRGDYFFSTDTRNGPMVEVGPVWYSIELDQLPDLAEYRDIFKNQSHLVLRGKIGEFDVPPSRESLEYTQSTVANLTKRLIGIAKEAQAKIDAMFASFTNVWEAANAKLSEDALINAFAAKLPTRWGLFHSLSSIDIPAALDKSVFRVKLEGSSLVNNRASRALPRGVKDMAVYVFDAEKGDTPTSWRRRVVADMKAKDIRHGLYASLPAPSQVVRMAKMVLDPTMPREKRKQILDGRFADAKRKREEILALIENYGCPVVVQQDQLPEPFKPERSAVVREIAIYRRNGRYSQGWEIADYRPLEENKINLVFELTKGKFPIHFNENDLRKLVKENTDMEVGDIIGVSASNFRKFVKATEEFTDYREVFSAKMFDVPALQARLRALRSTYDGGVFDPKNKASNLRSALRLLPQKPYVIEQFLIEADRAAERLLDLEVRHRAISKDGPQEEDIRLILNMIGVEPEVTPFSDVCAQAEAAYKRVMECYPDLRSFRFQMEQAAVYVLGTDALNAQRGADFVMDTVELEMEPPQPEVEVDPFLQIAA